MAKNKSTLSKNLLITASVIAIITSSSAFGGVDADAVNRTGFYLKANVGANKMNSAKERIENKSVESKSEVSPVFGIGIGGYISNYIRTDLTFDYSKIRFDEDKVSGSFREYDYDRYYTTHYDISLDREASIYSLMLNNYIDFPITEKANFFVGGGIGLARIKEKLKCTLSSSGYAPMVESASTKNKNNFAYSLTAGFSARASTNATIELAYSYRDFGKTHYKENYDNPDSNRYKGHALTIGVRFDV